MMLAFAVFTGLGLAFALWGEISERRRLGRMARDCRRRELES